MKLIPNYKMDGAGASNGNTVLATRTNSSFAQQRNATYTRKPPVYNNAQGNSSVPTSGVIFRKDVLDADGKIVGQKLSASVDFRLPTLSIAGGDALVDELILDLRAYVNDPDLKANLLGLYLPSCCSDEE